MKVVIIVLILIALIFIGFVVRGALRDEPDPPRADQMKGATKTTERPGWSESIKDLFSSLKPGLKMGKKFYTGPAEEKIPADKQPFRTATFVLEAGRARIEYKDVTPIDPKNDLSEMDNPQICDLPQDPDDVKDTRRCSIMAMKGGGTFKFECVDDTACRVKVE